MSTLRGAIAAPRLTAMLERQAENTPVFAFSKILDAPNVRAIIVPSSLVESLSFDISEKERHELYQACCLIRQQRIRRRVSILARELYSAP